jgi:hypothetical protein
MDITHDWKPEQIVLFMLSHKQEFLDQIKASDPAVFEAVNTLITKLTTAKVSIAFQKLNILPTFSKDMLVWKLPLVDTSTAKIAEDIIVKELETH